MNILTIKSKRAFTLIELLVVISIISLLASVVLASLNSARERGNIAAGQQLEANILHGIGDQLVGEWKFNDGAGLAIDTSSYGSNGTPNGATWIANGGYDGKGVYSLTPSSYISFKTSSNLNLSNSDFTISAWVNYNSTVSGGDTIFYEGSTCGGYCGTGDGNQFNISNDKLSLSFYGPVATGKTTLPHNKWIQVAVSFQNSNKTATFYVNGTIDKVMAMSPLGGPTFANIGCAMSGARYCTGYFTKDFTGKIDNLRVYKAVITAMEIKNIYAEGLQSHQDLALTK